MSPTPPVPRRRSPALNALIVGAIVLALVIGGAIIWKAWSEGSRNAVEEAHDAVVQPVQPLRDATVRNQESEGRPTDQAG